MDPVPPRVTVSIPGRSGSPAELLTGGPPPRERAPVPRWVRPVAAAAGVLALTAFALGQGRDAGAPPAASATPEPSAARTAARTDAARAAPDPGPRGIGAAVTLRRVGPDAPYVERVTLTVTLRGADLQGHRPGSPPGQRITLLEVAAPAFQVSFPGRPPPVALRVLDPTSTEVVVVALAADVVVSDCALEPLAQRRFALRLRRGDGPPELLHAQVSPPVVRVLDRLVSRTCRRTPG